MSALAQQSGKLLVSGRHMDGVVSRGSGLARQISDASTVYEAIRLISSAYSIDFVTYHLASTVVNEVDSPFVRTTYPESWVTKYLLSGYVRIDPVVKEGFERQLPFDWREIEITPDTLTFLEDARRHGVGAYGLSIPLVDKMGRRAILSFNADTSVERWNEIVTTYRGEWMSIAQVVHGKAVFELHGTHDPIPALTARERECLQWSALGKDYKEIALILSLSQHTTRSYLKSARTKLGCGTLNSATALAVKLRLITI